ncbi:MAG: response regulator [Phycisphaerales bacterium]
MDDQGNQLILSSIKRFRILAVGLAIIVVLLTSFLLHRVTSTVDSATATKINLAGKQRMLSQRILTDAIIIDNSMRTKEWAALKPANEDLQRSMAELQSTHNTLFSGNKELKIKAQIDQEWIDAYLGTEDSLRKMSLAAKEIELLTTSMIRRAPYIDEQTALRVAAAKSEIQAAQEIYLPRANHIVDLYETKYKDEIASSTRKAKAGLIFLVLILASILLFVIEPTFLIVRKQLVQLNKAIENATRADAVRWRLLTNIGHEFRTPMTAIMGFADLLKEDALSSTERDRLVKSIFESSIELTSLIETMLDMSAIEAGQLRIGKARCDLHQILTHCCVRSKETALAKGLNVNLMIDKNCPQFIYTDPKRLEQILGKITDNAIKFTESGCVNIQAKIVSKNNKDMLDIKVADTGIGIEKDHINAIFNPFQQAEDALTRQYGGAGLGLSISRDIAKALGGNISVASTPGVGSTFIITIDPGDLEAMKIEPKVAKAKKNDGPKPLDGYKLLIVDDAKDNRMLLKHILKKTGAEIEFAMDGKQALEAVDMGLQIEQPFDLILMDMQMPVMDGYFATVKLREQGINTPVIAVTAHALEGDRQHCLDSGCNDYLTKPINKKLLIETCARVIDEAKSPSVGTAKAA